MNNKPVDWSAVVMRNGFTSEKELWDHYVFGVGWSYVDIAKAIGVGIQSTLRRGRILGYLPGNHKRVAWEKLSIFKGYQSEASMWDELYERRGWGFNRIGEELGVSGYTVELRRKALGLRSRPRGGPNGRAHYPNSTAGRIRRIPDARLAEMSTWDVAALVDTSVNTARYNLVQSKRTWKKWKRR